jgi:hypothetical protein
MSEQDDAISDLRGNDVLPGLAWAWTSARRQTLQSFDPETGHDQGWLGYNAFKVLVDRLDRVFSLGRFMVPEDEDPALGADLVAQGLTSGEFERMPRLLPGTVVRDDLNYSPGWRSGGWRILLQSYGGRDIDQIPWPQKSRTKRRVANQPRPDQPMLPLEVLDLRMAFDALEDLSELAPAERVIVTLVGAYSIDAVTGESAFYLGHPRLNVHGGDAWHWRVLVEDGTSAGPGRRMPASTPSGTPSSPVADAPVRLRRPAEGTADPTGDR